MFPFPPWSPGQPREEPLETAVQQGVYPQTGGVVDFLSRQIDLTQLDPGPYLISVATLDVLGEEFDHVPVEVEVPPNSTMINGDGTVFSTPAGVNSGIYCGSG